MSKDRPITVLLVEDDPADARLAREAIHEQKIRIDLYIAVDGVEALRFLDGDPEVRLEWWPGRERGEPKPAELRRPDLILLDLRLPRMDGREFLARAKGSPATRGIPVVVFTSSDDEADVEEVWELGAAAYVQKPIDLEQFATIVAKISEFWFSIVRYAGE
jgi:CheY-like chemotaxis protein